MFVLDSKVAFDEQVGKPINEAVCIRNGKKFMLYGIKLFTCYECLRRSYPLPV